jgi:hypothetical protein
MTQRSNCVRRLLILSEGCGQPFGNIAHIADGENVFRALERPITKQRKLLDNQSAFETEDSFTPAHRHAADKHLKQKKSIFKQAREKKIISKVKNDLKHFFFAFGVSEKENLLNKIFFFPQKFLFFFVYF